MGNDHCPFCAILADEAPAVVVAKWVDVVAIEPLNPVTIGHALVIPRVHVEDATVDPVVTGRVFQCAAAIARPHCNLIASVGAHATQTIQHLHVHVVPRAEGDGLMLPWAGPNEKESK